MKHVKRKVAIETFGCRLNLFESDGIMGQIMASDSYEITENPEQAEVFVVNTCTVTDQADQKNRQLIQKAHKKNPDAKIVVTGCYAQTDPEELRNLPGVALVVGNDRKAHLLELIESKLYTEARSSQSGEQRERSITPSISDSAFSAFGPSSVFAYGNVMPVGHTRAYLKIQDGCDRKCTYCKIPQARGSGISRSFEDVIEHARMLDERGVPEIVLTGVNLGWYKSSPGGESNEAGSKKRFGALVLAVLENLKRARLRLSSIEPCDVDEQLAELSTHARFCDFLHVPLQSGSREMLKRMRRTYNPVSFRKRLETVRKHNPDIFLGTDVITGFPGESEAHFQETVKLCQDLEMANIHAFPFSPRRGTLAAEMNDRPAQPVVRARMEILKNLKDSGYAAYASKFKGKVREAIVEKENEALTDNFLRLKFTPSPTVKRGEMRPFQIERLEGTVLYSIPL
ncbi:MAG: tRNA (N(6)-L-threonylcarbamoyladenosine(37)-C(2))-methylthiotransferase MtaB [Leptospirales bacterium]|nr:tRNA (N(6)-L-threonylcarbamoyladenosine(37)-C(2))-methylthiotransferase MtaB [Leptospirales bacterium]